MFSKSRSSVSEAYTYNKTRLLSLDCVTVLCRKVFSLRKEEKDQAAVEELTVNVSILSIPQAFPYKFPFDIIPSAIFLKLATFLIGVC